MFDARIAWGLRRFAGVARIASAFSVAGASDTYVLSGFEAFYFSDVTLSENIFINTKNRSHSIMAEVTIPSGAILA